MKAFVAAAVLVLAACAGAVFFSWPGHVEAQLPAGLIELACPAGSSPVPVIGQTFNQSTGKYRQAFCLDSNGNFTGNMPAAIFAAGSGAGAGTFLRGDGTWAASASSIPSGGVTRTTLGSDQSITASTDTTVITKAVTFPSSGGPWRAQVCSSLYYLLVSGAVTISTWVSDATNVMASGQTCDSGTNAVTGSSVCEMSPVTYANGAGVTYTVHINLNSNMTVKVAPNAGSGTNSFLGITVFWAN